MTVACFPATAAGQSRAPDVVEYHLERLDRPALLGPPGMLALNTLVGGVTTGLVRELRGGSFLAGFRAGAIGGTLVFAGKTVAVQRFSGAGLAGRQLAAVGGSIAANGAAGAPALSRLELPLGPVRFVLGEPRRTLTLRLDPVGMAVLTYAVVEQRLRLDAGASLSAGTPIFRGDAPAFQVPVSGARAAAVELSSVILLADLSAYDARTRSDILAHERVHTIQGDAFQSFFGRALLEWLAPASPGWQRVVGLLDVNLGEAAAELAVGIFARRGIWEIEAEHIGR
jgi:hypothetical protein